MGTCHYCEGSGSVTCCGGGLVMTHSDRSCPNCHGIGRKVCSHCNGTGVSPAPRKRRVRV